MCLFVDPWQPLPAVRTPGSRERTSAVVDVAPQDASDGGARGVDDPHVHRSRAGLHGRRAAGIRRPARTFWTRYFAISRLMILKEV